MFGVGGGVELSNPREMGVFFKYGRIEGVNF